jgi:hypothetical protein
MAHYGEVQKVIGSIKMVRPPKYGLGETRPYGKEFCVKRKRLAVEEIAAVLEEAGPVCRSRICFAVLALPSRRSTRQLKQLQEEMRA